MSEKESYKRICTEEMLDFFKCFDPVQEKYGIPGKGALNPYQYAIGSLFDDSQIFGKTNKHGFNNIIKSLQQVYDDEEIVRNDVFTYHLAEKTIIHKYLGISQLNSMFDEDYFEFEWDMHVGQNFNEHHSQYYRDHFVHQIRNFFMMYDLLKGHGFEEAIREIFENNTQSNIIAEYVRKKLVSFYYDKKSPQRIVLDDIFSEDKSSSDTYTKDEYARDYFYSYVIMGSSMLSALFHDMGYPVCHFLSMRQRTSSYNPALYMFTHNAIDSFDTLASKLGASLLFTVVPVSEIQQRLRYNSDKKSYDHGAYSAIAFLIQFYDNGQIYSLSQEKQCAIEMAALAIYNHTAKFKAIKNEDNVKYQTMVFEQNPISFLLRFCDDLQEWDRQYFEISKSSDLLFCEKCGTPCLKEKGDVRGRSFYYCHCMRTKGNVNKYVRPDIFIKRKLYLVSVADSVTFKEEREELVATIKYDYYKMLMLCNINNTYASHRLKENGGVRKLLTHQNFRIQTNGKLTFARIKINYFMTNNPVLIKVKILDEALTCIEEKEKIELSKLYDKDKKSAINKLLEQAFGEELPLYFDSSQNKTIDNRVGFYFDLLKECRNQKASTAPIRRGGTLIKQYLDDHTDESYQLIMAALIEDSIAYYRYHIDEKPENDDADRELYSGYVSQYTDADQRFNQYIEIDDIIYIGYYADMYLFYRLNELIHKNIQKAAETNVV